MGNVKLYLIFGFWILSVGLLDSHVADFHFRTPSELSFEQKVEKEEEIEKDRETLYSDSSSYEEKLNALDRLLENGGIS